VTGKNEVVARNPAGGRTVRLEDVGQVRGGYIVADASGLGRGQYRALQASDIPPDGAVSWSNLRAIEPERDAERYAIREGDILLALRSSRTSAFVARGVAQNTIALGSWALITTDPTLAIPEFLSWYLNHPATSQRLNRISKGSKIQFLSLGALREFEIQLPPLKVQHGIARVHALYGQMQALEQVLIEARSRLVDVATMQALHLALSTNSSNS
jgi:hypothetical protein